MDNKYMNLAIKESIKAMKTGNVPVGAVIVRDGKVISRGYNLKNSKSISLLHAEIVSIYKACKKLNKWILDDCELYVTMKPCKMCYYAIAESRIRKVYYLMDSNYYEQLEKNGNSIDMVKLEDSYNYFDIVNKFFSDLRGK